MERSDLRALTPAAAPGSPTAPAAEFEALARRVGRLGAGAAALLLFLIPLGRFLRVAAARFAATLGTGALVAWMARRAGNPLPLALALAGLWLSCFSLSGFFFDLARVDALLTFLLVAAMAVLLEDVRRPRRVTFALLVMLAVLAVLVKQNTVVYLVAMAAGLAGASGWRRGAAFAAWAAGALALAVLALQAGSDGWFWFYAVSVPRSHGVEWSSLVDAARAAGSGACRSPGWPSPASPHWPEPAARRPGTAIHGPCGGRSPRHARSPPEARAGPGREGAPIESFMTLDVINSMRYGFLR